jgi:hypothetical protein
MWIPPELSFLPIVMISAGDRDGVGRSFACSVPDAMTFLLSFSL